MVPGEWGAGVVVVGFDGVVGLAGVEPSAYSRQNINIAPVEKRGHSGRDETRRWHRIPQPPIVQRGRRVRLGSTAATTATTVLWKRGRGSRGAGTEETSGGKMGALDALGLPLCPAELG